MMEQGSEQPAGDECAPLRSGEGNDPLARRLRRRTLVFKVGAASAAFMLTLAGVEALLATLRITSKDQVLHVMGKGTTKVPGAFYMHRGEGSSEGRFNAHGFRDYERGLAKAPNSYRIAVFGDSFVEGLQVDLAQTFPAVLERKLNERYTAPRFEVLNFGESGFGTTDELMRYRNFGVEYAPDLVIVAFFTKNDFRNNHRKLNFDQGGFYYRVDAAGDLVLDDSLVRAYERSLTPAKRLYHALKRHSYLVSLFSDVWYVQRLEWHKRQVRSETPPTPAAAAPPAGQLEEFSDNNVYRLVRPAIWNEAFEITRRVLVEFKHEVERHGAQFLLVTLTNSEQIEPEQWQRLTAAVPGLDRDAPDRFLGDVARDADIPCLPLLPAFREYRSIGGASPHGFGNGEGHWNEIGHRQAAQVILQFLDERWRCGVPPPGLQPRGECPGATL